MATTTPNVLNSTTGDDWAAVAKDYASISKSPVEGAVRVLLEGTNARKPFAEATAVLDNGCGPGPITSNLLKQYTLPADCTIVCSDFSNAMIEQVNAAKAEQLKQGNEAWSRVSTIVSNAMDMSTIDSESQTHVLAGWVYFMTPDPQKCVSETLRMLKTGGVLGLTSWQGSQWLEAMKEIKVAGPGREMPDLPSEWSSAEGVRTELEKGGFSNVESFAFTVHMGYESHRKMARFFLEKMPMLSAQLKGLSQDEINKVEDAMVAKMKEFNPEEPGQFSGQAIVGIGSKA